MPSANRKYWYGGGHLTLEEIQQALERSSRVSRIKKTLQLLQKGKTCLDIGCHTGYFTFRVAEHFKKVIGIDYRKENIELAYLLFPSPKITYLVQDVMHLDFPPNSFDCVVMTEVIEHMMEPGRVLQSIHRILKPKGHIVLSTPNAVSLKGFIDLLAFFPLRKMLKKVQAEKQDLGSEQDHYYNWDIITLTRLLERNGFRYVDHAFAGANIPWVLQYPLNKLRIHVPEPKFLLPLLGRFSAQIILKCQKI